MVSGRILLAVLNIGARIADDGEPPVLPRKVAVLYAVPRQIFLVLLDVAEFDVQRLLEQAVLRQRVEEELVREADELEIWPVRALPPVVRATTMRCSSAPLAASST